MISVPEDWRVLPLAQVLQPQSNKRLLQQGWSPQCLTHQARDDATWAVVKTTAIQFGWFDPTQNKELPKEMGARPRIEILEGDLLMTCAGPRSRCGVPTLVRHTRPRLMMSGKMYRFRPLPAVDARFLEKWLLSSEAQSRIDKMKTGISDSGLNLTQDRFLELPIPVPALHEQRRIVEILEDHLSRLDAGADGLDTAMTRAQRLAASALASMLYDAKGHADTVTTTIGALAEVGTGATPSRSNPEFYEDGEVPWVVSGDLSQGLIRRATQFVTQRALQTTSLKLNPAGTLLVAMYGEGKTRGTVAELAIAATTNQACASVQLHDPELRPWIRAALEANYRTMRRLASGGVQPNLNLSLIRSIELPLPPTGVRRDLLAELSATQERVRLLSPELEGLRRRSDALRRALLAAAFSGKLTRRHSDQDGLADLADALLVRGGDL